MLKTLLTLTGTSQNDTRNAKDINSSWQETIGRSDKLRGVNH